MMIIEVDFDDSEGGRVEFILWKLKLKKKILGMNEWMNEEEEWGEGRGGMD